MSHMIQFSTFWLILLCTFSGATIFAQSTAAPDRFKQLDKNSDGTLSRDEVTDSAAFTAADSDKDNRVTVEEYRRYVANRTKTKAPATVTPDNSTTSSAPTRR